MRNEYDIRKKRVEERNVEAVQIMHSLIIPGATELSLQGHKKHAKFRSRIIPFAIAICC